jgi:hypothetical protein
MHGLAIGGYYVIMLKRVTLIAISHNSYATIQNLCRYITYDDLISYSYFCTGQFVNEIIGHIVKQSRVQLVL